MLILLGVVKGSSNLGNCLSWGWLKYRVKNARAIASIRGTELCGSSRGVRCAARLCLTGERDLDPTCTDWEGGREDGVNLGSCQPRHQAGPGAFHQWEPSAVVLGTAWCPVLVPAGARGLPGAGGSEVCSGTASRCSSSGSPGGDLGLLQCFLRS